MKTLLLSTESTAYIGQIRCDEVQKNEHEGQQQLVLLRNGEVIATLWPAKGHVGLFVEEQEA